MPECPFRALTGVPCPFCGTTRSLVALAHGDVLGALALNPGVLLAIAAMIAWGIVRWRRGRASIPLWSPWAVVGALWSFQLVKVATGRPF